MMTVQEFEKWFEDNKARFEDLQNIVVHRIRQKLSNESVDYQEIISRVKDTERASEKFENGELSSPSEITDLFAMRVITQLHSQVEIVRDCLTKASFLQIEPPKVRSEKLLDDEMGLRSTKLICKLQASSTHVSPSTEFSFEYCFEIQICSLLEHSWMEIEHDRLYKARGIVGEDHPRRYKLILSTLELCNNEFERLNLEIADHREELEESAAQSATSKELTLEHLQSYLPSRLASSHPVASFRNGAEDKRALR